MKTPAAGHRRPPQHMHLVAEVCDDSWRHQRQVVCKTCQKSSIFSYKVEPKWGLGPIWGEDESGKAKKGGHGQITQPIWDVIFVLLEDLLRCLFLMFFWEGLFFGPWATFGRPRCPKGCQSDRNDSKKGGKRELKVRKYRFRRTLIFG